MPRFLLYLLLPLLFLLSVPQHTKATHLVGSDLRYECLGNNIYRVHVYIYILCDGAGSGASGALQFDSDTPLGLHYGAAGTLDPPFDFEWCAAISPTGNCSNPLGCPEPVQIGDWTFVLEDYIDVTPTCEEEQTVCTDNNSDIRGVDQGHYFIDFDFSNVGACTEWTFATNAINRNNGILNLQGNSGTYSMWNGIEIDLTTTPCNNSVEFLNPPSPFFCLGESVTFNQNATDLDGDSLVYSLVPCRDQNGTQNVPIASAPGFSPQNFVSSSTGVTIDPLTGDISITPSGLGSYTGCVSVEEYRDSVLINTTVRDVQVFVIACDNSVPTPGSTIPPIDDVVFPPNVDPTALTDTVFEFVTCTEADSINFDILLYDPDSTELTVDFDPIDFFGGTVDVIYDPNYPTVTRLRFRREALPPRFAPYNVLVTARDGACPLEGVNQRTYQIFNRGGSLSLNTFAFPNCDVGNFSAPVFGGTGGSLNYTWFGEGGLTGDSSTISYQYPDTGTYKYFVEASDAFGCTSTDSGEITILTKAIDDAVAFSQEVVCQFDTITAQYAGADTNAVIEWNFGSAAVPFVASGPGPHKVTWFNSGPKPVTITFKQDGCEQITTRNIIVSPKPLINAGANQSICSNENGTQLNAQINIPDTGQCVYSWAPAFGLNDPTSQAPIANPAITRDYTLLVNCGGCNSDLDDVRVVVNQAPEIFFDKPAYGACENAQGATVIPTITDGTGTLTYNWSPSAGVSSPNTATTVLAPTTSQNYSLTVTDQQGCVTTRQAFVEVYENPRANAQVLGSTINQCAGGTAIQLLGDVIDDPDAPQGSYSYAWSPATGLSNPNVQNPFADPPTSTVYQLTVTNDLTGCSSDVYPLDTLSVFNFYVVTPPTPKAGPDVSICKGDSVQIGLNVNIGQIPDVEYQWLQSTGLSSDTVARPWAKPSKTTVYNLRVHKNGCWTDADTVTVTINERPTVSGQQFYEICAGDTLQLDATAARFDGSTNGLSYHWTPDNGSMADASVLEPLVFPTQTTTYQFFAGNKGCESVTPLNVQVAVKPRPTLDADVTNEGLFFCGDGNSVTLDPQFTVPTGNDSLYISWTPAAGLNDSTLINPEARPEQSTVYYLTLAIDGANGCAVTDSVEVFVGPDLGLTLEADTTVICNGETVNLMASGGIGAATLEWLPASVYLTPGSTDSLITALPDSSTTLSVVASEGGCVDTASIDIEVLAFPEAAFEATYSRGCIGMAVLFNNLSTGGTQYVWDFGDGSPVNNIENPVHTYGQEGIYTVQLIAKAAGGCANWDTIQQQVVVGGAIAADFTSTPLPAQQLYLPNANVSFTPGDTSAVSYTWLFGDGQSSTDMMPVHTYQVAGQYEVTLHLVDQAGCSYTRSKGTYLVSDDVISELTNVFTPNNDGVNDEWLFQYNGTKSVEIRIVSRNGQLVFSSSNPNAAWNGLTENGNEIQEGVYFYTITIGEEIFRGNITVLR